MWYVKVSRDSAHLTIAHALFQKHSVRVQNDDPSYFVFRTVGAGEYRYKILDIFGCAHQHETGHYLMPPHKIFSTLSFFFGETNKDLNKRFVKRKGH